MEPGAGFPHRVITMKKITISKRPKLVLAKTTVRTLDRQDMAVLAGGASPTHYSCPLCHSDYC
jgi:hypothetical protein